MVQAAAAAAGAAGAPHLLADVLHIPLARHRRHGVLVLPVAFHFLIAGHSIPFPRDEVIGAIGGRERGHQNRVFCLWTK